MQIYEIYFKSIYNECVIYVLLTIFIIKVTTQHPYRKLLVNKA